MALRGRENKAQSILEYVTVIVCAVTALITMQVYIKRAYQWKLKQSADQFGPQYAPRRTTGSYTTTYTSDSVTQAIPVTEVELGYDLDGDGALSAEVTGTRSISGLGTFRDSNGDGIIQPGEMTGGVVTTYRGSETVGAIRADEGLFDE